MKVFILDETFELENKLESVEEVFDYIKQALDETEYNFNYMIVDGAEVHNEFEIFLEENIENIKEITIVMKTTEEVVKDSFNKISVYLEQVAPIIGKLAHNFRVQPEESDLQFLKELFEGIEFIFQTRESIDYIENSNEIISDQITWNDYIKYVKALNVLVQELKQSVASNNMNQLSESLSNKLIPLFKDMKIKLDILSK